ncbi:ThiF family adenylyltransferase [Agromyces aerolatus]|uniref:ThiF family adenylyltransferase n=1 Tax=Agromyces sp. LY-1074 TaxID=3074080 RepID=UPI002858CDFA|nr:MULTISPECIES: ThiF family adenylyltransferase [unclassified Agromyces]MDR5698203.1 ThiF family adenylyltransferase [Agromyces sp. LY-1074]MDR5704497.1 ThiF family adenylyltransferase [Agromyces sp. LY-1358]
MGLPPLVEPVAALPEGERGRTDRQRRLPEIGDLGQRRLAAARVVVLGAGGLGAPALTYLAAAGVGTIGIVDDDVVELSNLHRQPVHGAADLGRPKVDSAAEAVHALAPDAVVQRHAVRLDRGNAAEILGGYDLVVDGTDTFETRYLVDDVCAELGLPLVWATVLRFDAQLSVFWAAPPAGEPVRLRTLFPAPPAPGEVPSCAEAGVLGALCGQVGAMMAQEAVKLITGIGEPLLGRVLVIDALRARQREVPLRAAQTTATDASAEAVTPAPGLDPRPPSSGAPRPTVRAGITDRGTNDAGVSGPPSSVRTDPTTVEWIEADALRERLRRRAAGDDRFVLVDVREPDEHEAGAISGSVLLPLGEVLRDPEGVRANLTAATSAPEAANASGASADAPIIVHCRTDQRSRRAALALARIGEPVTVLRGGYLAWTDLTTAPPPPVE